jgi:hypothetical protein
MGKVFTGVGEARRCNTCHSRRAIDIEMGVVYVSFNTLKTETHLGMYISTP